MGIGAGLFLGGFQEGESERRQFDLKKETEEKASARADEELKLSKTRTGLAAAELAHNKSLSERKFEYEKEKDQTDNAARDRGLSVQERALKIQQDAEQFKHDQEISTRADGIISNLMSTVKETSSALRATGKTPDEVAGVVKPLVDKIVSLSQKTNLNSDAYVAQIQTMLAAPTPNELEAAKGTASATGRLAEANALSSGGVNRQSALETAGVKGPPKEIDLRTFTMPDGTIQSLRADDSEGINKVLSQKGVSTPISVQAQDLSGVGVAMPDKKAVSEASSSIRNMQSNIESIDEMVKAFEKSPESAGLLGLGIEHIGGLVAQIPLGVGNAALEKLGIDKKTVSETRTKARAAIGQVLRLVSQDNSRFSDSDRKLAESTLGAMDANADWETVVNSGNTVLDIMKKQQLKDIDEIRVAAKLKIGDLETDEGINKLGELLTNKGMTQSQALTAIESLQTRFGISLK